MDSNICTKNENNYQIIIVVYVDDIIFGGCKKEICEDFASKMKNEFEMSMIGELSYFLGLQINQLKLVSLFLKLIIPLKSLRSLIWRIVDKLVPQWW